MTSIQRRREHAERILGAAVTAAHPADLVRRSLHGAVELNGPERIHLLAIGKAAASMSQPVLDLLEDRIAGCLIVLPHGTPADLPAIHGAHPLPDESSVAAGTATMELLGQAGEGDLVLALLSGGGSSVAVQPLPGISVADYARCIDSLMRAGTEIGELNLVRKHIDALKGGGMAALAAPAGVLCLALSDVVGDAVETIASGPFSADPTTGADALRVLQRHGALDDCPPSIRRVLEAASSRELDDATFENVRVRVVGGNDVAVNGAADMAAELGYRVMRPPYPVAGPAREAGVSLASEARRIQREQEWPVCIVAGGETTVAVQGRGRGGRNQELVLAACIELDGATGITVGSIGTDGVDGPTDAAGAIADEESIARAAANGAGAAAALRDNDSYHFHQQAGGLLITGPTDTNVNDVQIALIDDPWGADV
ncbi:glycerate kinase [soil metagenome]